MSLKSYIRHQPNTDHFNSQKLVTALIFKDLPREHERVRSGVSTLLRRCSSVKGKKQRNKYRETKMQTSAHDVLCWFWPG